MAEYYWHHMTLKPMLPGRASTMISIKAEHRVRLLLRPSLRGPAWLVDMVRKRPNIETYQLAVPLWQGSLFAASDSYVVGDDARRYLHYYPD